VVLPRLPRARRRRIGPWIAGFFLLVVVARLGAALWVENLWFGELGYADVFRTRLGNQILLGLVGWVLAFPPLLFSFRAALRRSPSLGLGPRAQVDLVMLRLEQRLPLLVGAAAAALALGLAASLARQWLVLQTFLHRQPYGLTDPIFSRDLGFHLFTLPAFRTIHSWLLLVTLLTGLGTLVVYGVRGGLVDARGPTRAARTHLGWIAALFLGLLSFHFVLAQYDILHSRQGAVYGACYTDAKAGLLGLRLMVGVTLAGAGILLAGVLRGRWLYIAAGPAAVAAAYVLSAVIVPSAVQKLVVEPNELMRERPYIENALRFTREAYGLEDIESRPFQIVAGTPADILQGHEPTLENVRLWDWRPLLATYRQIQEIRPYYNFGDVDVDRYQIGGRQRQVMLSARELAYDQLNEDARTWVNLHLKYTHGYGLCMSPVNEISGEGLPSLYIRDIPPVSVVEIQVTRPEIYYGEQTTEFVLTGTTEDEFDYPAGEANQFVRYSGEGGIRLGSFARRLLLAWHLRSRELLFTGAIQPESRVLLYRTLDARLRRLAPFLRYDRDPYLVIHDGRLFWVIDAYTVSDRFPYSQPHGGINYIRNAVKVVVDAYHGTTTFYIADAKDPLLAVYRAVFPSLFRPLADLPDGIRAHLRYPVDLFSVQAETFATFHMEDPQVFYNREDLWQIPIESFEGREIVMEPYYTIMRLPGGDAAEMILMLPFTPSRKDNMIAWLAARCDGEALGRRVVFQFPKQELVYGPRQIEARIDQDADISQQLTLWSQRGSNVIRGNLLVIPLGGSVLYVEPLYLRAESGALPELKRVIVALGNRIAMDVSLETALARVLGAQVSALPAAARGGVPAAGAGASTSVLTADGRAVAGKGLELLREAETASRAGDWAAYGKALERLRQHLEQQAAAQPPAASPPRATSP